MSRPPWEITIVGGRLAVWMGYSYFIQMVGKRYRPDEPTRFKWLGVTENLRHEAMLNFTETFTTAEFLRVRNREFEFVTDTILTVSETDLVMMKLQATFISDGPDGAPVLFNDPPSIFFEDEPFTFVERVKMRVACWFAPFSRLRNRWADRAGAT